MDYVSAAQGKHAGSYIHNTINAMKPWLAHNGIELKRKVKITGAYETPTVTDERVPTKDELRRVPLSASKQPRVVCALVAHGEVSFEESPAMIIIRPSLSKAPHQYFTFLTGYRGLHCL